ncbi:MAG: beta-N-acetylhexosaminidase [Anaerolineae bacterium]
MTTPILLPVPRQMSVQGGTYPLPRTGLIALPAPDARFIGGRLQEALQALGLDWGLCVGSPDVDTAIHLHRDDSLPDQAYRLTIAETGIALYGQDAGLFYGVCTLAQLLVQYGRDLPLLTIDDAPDYPSRGVMLDISRDKVPTLETLMMLVDELASLKINQLQLYIEHTYAYRGHEQVWALASPMTADDILTLDAYCRERYVELVPNQNSLGHVERWLKFPRYLPLAEKPEGFVPSWGGPHRSASTLNPLDDGSLALMRSLYDQYLPQFTSKQFNVGCDEPWELGQGKSQSEVEARGGRVYLDWLLKLYEDVSGRGYRMMFWGDIITHYPELVTELPDDVIVMEWGYEADHAFDEHGALFAQSGKPFYVCPGTSSWNTLIGRTTNALGNLESAALNGLKHGAVGYLNTDWGDNGHMQPLPVSYLGFAYGAGVSWHHANNHDLDLAQALSHFVFRDEAGVMGQLAYDFGNAYLELPWDKNFNGHLLAYLAQVPYQRDHARQQDGFREVISADDLHHLIAHLDDLQARLDDTRMTRADADLIIREYQQATSLVQHAAHWLLFIRGESDHSALDMQQAFDGLVQGARDVWLARNRRGGLEDSIARLHSLRDDYQ